MNERIKLLAEQATQLVADEHTGGDESRLNTDSYHVKDLINEKFAELIVQECIRVPYDMWDKAELNADVAVKIEHRIKEHFGVEE
jgi:hypothetical protein